MFIVALFFMLLIAIWLRTDFYFKIVYLLAALYILSRMWLLRFEAKSVLRRKIPTHAFTGESLDVTVSVENTDWLPVLSLDVREDLPIELVSSRRLREAFSLGPKTKKNLSYTLRCRRRGFYPVGPLRVQTTDLLGILPPRKTTLPAARLTVYPRVVPLEDLHLPTHSPLAVLPAPSPLFEDPSHVVGVRSYSTGDSLRRIHWTASAHTGQILVKKYKPAITRETLVCLDFDEASYDIRNRFAASELAVTAAASIANHIVNREGLSVGLSTWAHNPAVGQKTLFRLPPRSGQAHLLTLLEALALVRLTKDAQFIDLLRQQKGTLRWGATMIAITGSKSQELVDTLLYLRQCGLAVALLLVYPGRASFSLDNPSGIPIYQIWAEADLEKGL